MKSLRVNFDQASSTIDRIDEAIQESWPDVCDRYDNDVSRIMDVTDPAGFTALYVCYDENNQPAYYLVEEDEALTKLRQKTFLSKLGSPQQ